MAVFKIFHVSDLHFGATPNQGNLQSKRLRRKLGAIWTRRRIWVPPTHNPQRANQLAATIYATRTQLQRSGDYLDALVVSGDLATTGVQQDLDAARDYVDGIPQLLWYRAAGQGQNPNHQDLATLKGLTSRSLIIPGNHDRYQNARADAGGPLFDTTFVNLWQARAKDRVVDELLDRPGDTENSPPERIAIIGADFSLRSNADATFGFLRWGQGYVDSQHGTFKELVDRTTHFKATLPDVPIVWVVHFPPRPRRLHEVMRNYHLVEQASMNLGVVVVLSGHTHVSEVHPAGAGSCVWNAGSATQFAEPEGNWFHLIEIEVRGGVVQRALRSNYKWKNVNGHRDYYFDGVDPIK